jgi:hypothetical protein
MLQLFHLTVVKADHDVEWSSEEESYAALEWVITV